MSQDHSPVVAGVVAAVVGFSSSFVVVLAGLVAVGATPALRPGPASGSAWRTWP